MTRKINETTIPTDGLVLDLPLDGNANARVGSDGTATNMVWQPAERGYVSDVGSFNGTNNYITTPQTAYGTSDFTWACWFKTTSTTARVMASTTQTTGYPSFINNADGTLTFRITSSGSTNCVSNNSLNDGEWHLVIGQRQGTTMRLYIDGALQDTQTKSGALDGTTLYLGNFSSLVSSTYWLGEIGLFKIYNKALSQEEISSLYSEGLRKFGPASAQIWRSVNNDFPLYTPASLPTPVLDISRPANGGTYYDQSGNGNNGVNTNVIDSAKGKYNVMSFNGSSSGVNIPSFSVNTFSISISVKPNSIITSSNEFIYYLYDGSDSVGLTWGHGSTSFQKSFYIHTSTGYFPCKIQQQIDVGKTYNIICVYDGVTAKVYVNGFLDNSVIVTGTIIPNNNFSIGYDGVTSYFNGEVISPTIYNRALSELEIQQLYYSSFIPN